jgi:hypothetical protein
MKRFLLIITISAVFIVLSGWLLVAIASDPLPPSTSDQEEAEQLADKMLDAIGKDAYDSLTLIEWSFPRGHHFVWEKTINRVTASWGVHTVVFYPDELTGDAYKGGQKVSDPQLSKDLVQEAWALFANGSFWLVAPFKVRDPGTTRQKVETENGSGLLVTYSSGGVTPGDSYLWILDESGKPVAWKMWVSILPVKGLEFSWEGGAVHQGVWLAPLHKGPMGIGVDLEIHTVR